ncbi:uncharacterized protein K02A2.6-like [Condylostylus longicornis]|uniref:uncharacterized protein K02A2.6-like n=1 Tax=Condylostylus longicornis TaxID=2530218 RepID=UPI00244E2A4E|nr:uncharacterized protein K02A2.6-like [Condylostylus longicornis]
MDSSANNIHEVFEYAWLTIQHYYPVFEKNKNHILGNTVEVRIKDLNNYLRDLEAEWPYNGSNIETLGITYLNVVHKNISTILKFYIVDSDSCIPILGLNACSKLKLIKRIDHLNLENINDLLAKYNDVFEGSGCFIKNFSIDLKSGAIPVARPARRIPQMLRKPLKDELERLCNKKAIEKVETSSDWVSNLVIIEKPNGKIRLCLDPQDLNKNIKERYYEIPSFEDIKLKFCNKKLFSVFDCREGFYQIELNEYSKSLCTFSTPFGLYRFTKLPFGLKIAPEAFQKLNEQNFGDIPNVIVYIDDLCIAASNEREHDETVKLVMDRARGLNVKFNKDKLQMQAIENLENPKNKKDLQKLMGFINYMGSFIPNLAEVSAPLRALLKNDSPTLKHFDFTEPISIQTDASRSGLGACLMQKGRPVCFASRSMTETEINYPQIDKEFLAVVYACKKFHNYIYGRKIEIITDHKPLLGIMAKKYYSIPSPRLQRLKLKLEKYNLNFRYCPGKYMFIADFLSRNFKTEKQECEEMNGLSDMIHTINVSDEKKKIFQDETLNDEILKDLFKTINDGWPVRKELLCEKLKPFWKNRNDLFVVDGLIFLNDRIFVPKSLRDDVLYQLHLPHLGVEKTKSRARSIVYWPTMNLEIEELIHKCNICEKYKYSEPREPLINHDIPEMPFSKIGLDIMELNAKSFLIIGDYYSKYLDIIPLYNKTARTIIEKLKVVFSYHGIPNIVIADNMPFNSYLFKEFAKKYDFKIITSSPLYPKSNGFAEKMVGISKRLLKKTKESNNDLWLSLLEYRNTPIKGSCLSPVEILMGRKTRTLLPVSFLLGQLFDDSDLWLIGSGESQIDDSALTFYFQLLAEAFSIKICIAVSKSSATVRLLCLQTENDDLLKLMTYRTVSMRDPICYSPDH